MPAGDIARALELAPSALTFHLDRRRVAGLATARRESRSISYAANFQTLNALLGFLTENCGKGAPDTGAVTRRKGPRLRRTKAPPSNFTRRYLRHSPPSSKPTTPNGCSTIQASISQSRRAAGTHGLIISGSKWRAAAMATAAASRTHASRMKSRARSGTALRHPPPKWRPAAQRRSAPPHDPLPIRPRVFRADGFLCPCRAGGLRRGPLAAMLEPSAPATGGKRIAVACANPDVGHAPWGRCEHPTTETSTQTDHRLASSSRGHRPWPRASTGAARHPDHAGPLSGRCAGGHGACPGGRGGSQVIEIKSVLDAGISERWATRSAAGFNAARAAPRSPAMAARPRWWSGEPLTPGRHGARAPGPEGNDQGRRSLMRRRRIKKRERARVSIRLAGLPNARRPSERSPCRSLGNPQGRPIVLERAGGGQVLDIIRIGLQSKIAPSRMRPTIARRRGHAR
jgi:ArsR family transcriptional regulator, arsenate/arsenite/antimonite-responsive transcriptional repressor